MESKRLLEICQGLKSARGGGVTRYCQSLIRELAISHDEIEATKIEARPGDEDNDVSVLRRKIVKAVLIRLRKHLNDALVAKGIIEVGKPLPVVGNWDNRTLLKIGTTGMMITKRAEDGSKKGTCDRDPLENLQLIALLA